MHLGRHSGYAREGEESAKAHHAKVIHLFQSAASGCVRLVLLSAADGSAIAHDREESLQTGVRDSVTGHRLRARSGIGCHAGTGPP